MPLTRAKQLHSLSHDHHHGLRLARLATQSALSGNEKVIEAAWDAALVQFTGELEPHFIVEERWIAPGLVRHGEMAMQARLLNEHAALRAFLQPNKNRGGDELARFGQLLEQHIRFEEREMFERIQALFTVEELNEIAAACIDRIASSCGRASDS